MSQNEDKNFVREFVGEDLWQEINRRIVDGQRIGQAFINSGDHADKPYSWEMPDRVVQQVDTWYWLAQEIRLYKSVSLEAELFLNTTTSN